MDKNKVKVLINGAAYTLVTSETPEYVQRVAIMVDRKIREIKGDNSELPNGMISMLTSINLADEYIKLLDSTDNLRKQITDYAKKDTKLTAALDERNERVKTLEAEVQELKLELARNGITKSGLRNKNK